MAFRTNYQNQQQSLIPEGQYEVVIENGQETATRNGIPCIAMTFSVRKDIDQQCQGQKIFHNIYMKHEPNEDDLSVGGYNYYQIMALSKAIGLEEGTEIPSADAWAMFLNGKEVSIAVRHEVYNGNTYARANYINPTKFPSKPQAQYVTPDMDLIPVGEDDDLPF